MFNIPALLITLLVTWVLVRGVRESAGANTTMVLIKIGAILLFCFGAAHAINTRQLASVRAARISGNSDGRVHRLLHLHRLRFRFDGRRGVQQPAARSALRHHRHADHLHDSLWFGFAGADGYCQLQDAEHGFAGGGRVESAGLQPAAAGCHRGRAGRE